MKKSLIALAVLAASGAAMAQSSVTMFGVVDTGVSYVKGSGDAGTSNYGMHSGANSSSRLGFRGVEDLGGGLKAGFWLEGGIGTDVGDGSGAGAPKGAGFSFQRRSTVSLMGNFGEVRLGRDEVAAYNKLAGYSPFSVIGVGAFRGWNTTTGDGIRQNNMIAYYTPNISGFNAGVNYAFGEQNNNSSASRYVGGYVGYNNGPLSVTLSADRKNNADLGVSGFNAAPKLNTYGLGASYDFGVVKVSGIAMQAKEKGALVNDKQNSYALGLSAPVGGVGEVKAMYALYDLKNDSANNAGEGKAHQLSLGYVHNLSKRTAVYGFYTYLKNKDGMNMKIGGTGLDYTSVAGKASNGVQVGVRHAF